MCDETSEISLRLLPATVPCILQLQSFRAMTYTTTMAWGVAHQEAKTEKEKAFQTNFCFA